MKNQHDILENCHKARPEQDYTHLQEIVDNLPYIFMTILGALVFIIGLKPSATNWLFAGLYVLYGIAGALWIIVFVCPYCHYYDTRACPCGYGQMLSRKYGCAHCPQKSTCPWMRR
jgi:hypothetical protein